jgi:hypothetical protein
MNERQMKAMNGLIQLNSVMFINIIYSRVSRQVLILDYDGPNVIHVYDNTTGIRGKSQTVDLPRGPNGVKVTTMAASSDGILALACDDNHLRFIEVNMYRRRNRKTWRLDLPQ